MKASLKIAYWAPRLLAIASILFISIFAFDAFDPRYSVIQQVGNFFLHLIPSIVLLLILLLAWKKELLGGVMFILVGLIFAIPIYLHNYTVNHFSVGQSLLTVLIVCLPFTAVGFLFLVSRKLHRKARRR